MNSEDYDPSSSAARFGHNRQSTEAGYHDVPNINTAMAFDLVQLPRVTSRIVRLGPQTLELWSPNSAQLPFLPGERLADFVPSIPANPAERRYDGHAGKHDCVYFPQYYCSDTTHWPFMRRSLLVSTEDPAYVAFAPLMRYWILSAHSTIGSFAPDFMEQLSTLRRELDSRMDRLRATLPWGSRTWNERPGYPDAVNISALLRIRVWEGAVDLGVAVQRGLREKEGWIAMVEARCRLHHLNKEKLRGLTMPLANDKYIGLWVNGLEEAGVLWHMVAKVPCFIAHEYSSTSSEVHPSTPIFMDLLQGTDAPLLIGNSNPYQQLARAEAARLDSLPRNPSDGRGPHRLALASDEERSSSLHLEDLPAHVRSAEAGGWGVPPDSRDALLSFAPPSPQRAQPQAAAPGGSGQNADEDKAKEDKYAHQPWEKRIPYLSRVPWIVPPSVLPPWEKKWEKWELAEVNDQPAFVYRGAKVKIDAWNEWFDRALGRRLFFGRYTPPPGVVLPERYGAPVPLLPFFVIDGERARPRKPSYWMYPAKVSPSQLVGRPAPLPDLDELPLQEGKGKERKRVVLNGMEVDEPEGVEEDLESSDDDFGEGMDVDACELEPEDLNRQLVHAYRLTRNYQQPAKSQDFKIFQCLVSFPSHSEVGDVTASTRRTTGSVAHGSTEKDDCSSSLLYSTSRVGITEPGLV
ncbi:hypothetical protein MVEN_01707800 [Mycena venus]|uniref:Uncharacterized protein n=1 Tax=Mycena venus TaxID=2733690 RepID=A0A8H6XP45_9AGAR|nr:hypothetical protein MVEN_01707800 [Mycena venus]